MYSMGCVCANTKPVKHALLLSRLKKLLVPGCTLDKILIIMYLYTMYNKYLYRLVRRATLVGKDLCNSSSRKI